MAEQYGVASNRPEARQQVCSVCTKRIGKGYFVFLGEQYFHAACFFATDDHGATERQVRHLRAAFESLKTLEPLFARR
jgi:hypothetical protein